jgi:hypothetical protein
MVATDPGTWIAAILTIGIISYMFGDNPLYRLSEYTMVGAFSGYGLALAIESVSKVNVARIQAVEIVFIIPIILGLLMYTRYSRRYGWVSRYPTAFLLGIGTGLVMSTLLDVSFVSIIRESILFVSFDSPLAILNSIVMIGSLASILLYFVFTRERRTVYERGAADIARYAMMAAFGATMAIQVTRRTSCMAGRLRFLLHDWLGLIP